MKTGSQRGFKIAGFRVTVDPLLPVVVILIGWLLSERYFPAHIQGYLPYVNYILGGAASVLLTLSILFHELGHAVAAVRSRLGIDRIHLMLFGGMAELRHRPIRGVDELTIALSGPLASLVLAGGFYAVLQFIPSSYKITAVLMNFVVNLNVMLAVFNLIPIYPLDGGRALRAGLWHSLRSYHRSSVVTLNTSYVLILVILVAAAMDYFLFFSGYALILSLLSVYMAYTIRAGRKELLMNPSADDLIFYHDTNLSIQQLIAYVTGHNPGFLERTNIPVTQGSSLVGILPGRSISAKASIFTQYITAEHTPPQLGDFIEVMQPESFGSDVVFSADFVPLLLNGRYHAICDAHELRFWMREKPHMHGKLTLKALSQMPDTNTTSTSDF
jgi:Zn-dependent protease